MPILVEGSAQEICEIDSQIGRCNMKIIGSSKAQKLWGICKSSGVSKSGYDVSMEK